MSKAIKTIRKTIEVPIITKAMQKAGILEIISGQHTNGSYTALVDLVKVVKDENINPRKLDMRHIADIVADFKPHCFDNPKVVFKKGKLLTPDDRWILAHINGQHTIAVALNANIAILQATCQVWFDKSDTFCAEIYYQAATNTKRMNTWDSYKSGVLAGDDEAVQIRDAIAANGFTCKVDNGQGITADLVNYAPLQEAYRAINGKRVLDRFLRVLTVFRDDNNRIKGVAAKGEFQRGLLDFVSANFDMDINYMMKTLDKKTAADYFKLATTAAAVESSRTNRGYCRDAFASVFPKGK